MLAFFLSLWGVFNATILGANGSRSEPSPENLGADAPDEPVIKKVSAEAEADVEPDVPAATDPVVRVVQIENAEAQEVAEKATKTEHAVEPSAVVKIAAKSSDESQAASKIDEGEKADEPANVFKAAAIAEPEDSLEEPVLPDFVAAAPVPQQNIVQPAKDEIEANIAGPSQPAHVFNVAALVEPQDQFEETLPKFVTTLPTAQQNIVQAAENEIEATNVDANMDVSAVAGRVQTLDLGDDSISSIEILQGPAYGNVTVNPDNTLALVLSGTTQTADLSFDVRVTFEDGATQVQTVHVDVTDGEQASGWGQGNFYMLETDADGDLVIEHGENHREVYVSGDESAFTLAEIAAREGINVDDITGKFLEQELPQYGATPDMALAEDAGDMLWGRLTVGSQEPSSHWLLLEKGFEYDDMKTVRTGMEGESEINPIYIGAYGEGAAPVIGTTPNLIKDGAQNVVVEGVHFTEGFQALAGENILISDTTFSGHEANFQNINGLTLRDSQLLDAVDAKPHDAVEGWSAHFDRESGIFMKDSSGVLIDGNLFDHNGWEEGYDPSGDPDSGQPASQYSHNVYFAISNRDVTFTDNIVARGASSGLQLRGGGVVEDNVFVDNNIGVLLGSGGKEDTGNYSLFSNNVVTSGGYHIADEAQGALALGVDNTGNLATLVDNIVTHLADPNNSSELEEKVFSQAGLTEKGSAPLYNDTIVYNWSGSRQFDKNIDERTLNIDGLETSVLDATTIQNFAAILLNDDDATIDDLAEYLRGQADGTFDDVVDADLIIAFFQTGFGLVTDLRSEADTLRFVPSDLADGIRWDNDLNWSTKDLPGTQDGDSVNLGGNWVNYSGTTQLNNLNLGEGGQLNVGHGFLQVDGHLLAGDKGATLNIDGAGQVFTDGYTDQDLLSINVDGGRFANTGLFTGKADLTVTDNGKVLLATDGADYAMGSDSRLTIEGDDTRVGFDGDQGDTAVLLMNEDADVSFIADEEGTMGTIEEFASGRFGDEPDVNSGINLGGVNLHLDVSNIDGSSAHSSTLMDADEIIGDFGDVEVEGLSSAQDVILTINYVTDTVELDITENGQGSGDISVNVTGDEDSAQSNNALWDALTNGHGIYSDDPAADIPADPDLADIEI